MKRFIVATIIAITAFLVIGSAVALASSGGGLGFFGMGHGAVGSDKVASLLGITTDELQTQLETTTLPELLDEKGITHQQLYEAHQAGLLEQQAAILGMSTAELQLQLEDKTFAELLDEKGISHTELQALRHDQRVTQIKEHLQQLVDEGTITEEQMEERLQRMAERDEIGVGFGSGMHRGGGLGFGCPGFQQY